MNRKKKNLVIDAALILASAALGITLAACNANGVNGNVCNGANQCVSFSEHPGSPAPASTYFTPPVQSESPQASIPGTQAPAPDATQAVQTCLPEYTGVSVRDLLIYWADNQGDLGCLAIPPQEVNYFIQSLLAYIRQAPPQTWQDQENYEAWQQQQVVPLVQRCQEGQS